MHWFGSFLEGGKAVLLKGTKPKYILDAVSQEKCTVVWLLVPWAQDILDAVDRGEIRLEDYELSQWRLMHIGAQPVPPSLIKRWKERTTSTTPTTAFPNRPGPAASTWGSATLIRSARSACPATAGR